MKSAVAVIDTETNWHDEVMSVGIVIAEKNTWKPLGTMYCIITPECCSGGMYSSVMNLKNIPLCSFNSDISAHSQNSDESKSVIYLSAGFVQYILVMYALLQYFSRSLYVDFPSRPKPRIQIFFPSV